MSQWDQLSQEQQHLLDSFIDSDRGKAALPKGASMADRQLVRDHLLMSNSSLLPTLERYGVHGMSMQIQGGTHDQDIMNKPFDEPAVGSVAYLRHQADKQGSMPVHLIADAIELHPGALTALKEGAPAPQLPNIVYEGRLAPTLEHVRRG